MNPEAPHEAAGKHDPTLEPLHRLFFPMRHSPLRYPQGSLPPRPQVFAQLRPSPTTLFEIVTPSYSTLFECVFVSIVLNTF